MSVLKFSDGVEIDTSGDLRPLHLEDGWYVVGNGYCIPVDSLGAAMTWIDNLTKKE